MDEIRQAFDLYNEMAKKIGVPTAQVLSDTRKKNIKARLLECGGLEGWKSALSQIERSAFLRGDNDRGWQVNIDFLITKGKFISIMEGKYDSEKKETAKEQVKREIYEWSQSEGEWSLEEKKKIAAVVNEIAMTQRKSKEDLDVKVVLRQWQRKFINKFSVDQIIYALDKHIEKNEWFPTVKNITDILEPEQPKITEAAFVEAQKWQEKNGWPMFSDAQITIDKYREQNKQADKNYQIECGNIAQIVNGTVKRIS